jgi:predicted RNA-binding protein with PIN domain
MQHFLIDGYNLLHVLGLMRAEMTPAGLMAARTRMLDLLVDRTRAREVRIEVVFDAANAPQRVPEQADYRGLVVHAAKRSEADDLIEGMIQQAPRRAEMTIVSNDRRLLKAAQRAGCVAQRCEEFLDWLMAPPPRAATNPEADSAKQDSLELGHWLREFGHLDQDPQLGQPEDFTR